MQHSKQHSEGNCETGGGEGEKGRELHGDDVWESMPEEERCVLDFLCGNHTRGLPVDAFNRLFEAWLTEELSEEFTGAAAEAGSRARLEKSGTSLLRSLFKLVHRGWGAYEKASCRHARPRSFIAVPPLHNACLSACLFLFARSLVRSLANFSSHRAMVRSSRKCWRAITMTVPASTSAVAS